MALRMPKERTLLASAGFLALAAALAAAVLTGVTTSSGEQSGKMSTCPLAGKWAFSTWQGPDATAVEQALGTCGTDAVDAAYWVDPQTQTWLRYFGGRPEISNLTSIDNMQAVLALGSTNAPATPTPPPSPVSSPTATAVSTGTPSPTTVPLTSEEYVGEGDFGLDIRLTVCDDGTCLEPLRLDWEACGFDNTWILSDVVVQGDNFVAFEAEDMPEMRFVSGRFTSPTTLEGYAIYAAEILPGFACTNGLMEWEAHLKNMPQQ